jgi:hypothetical protein
MAWYSPRQKENERWYYTCENSAGCFDIGNCSQFISCPKCRATYDTPNIDCEQCKNTRFISNPNACNGHDTPEDAIEHYRQYCLDSAIKVINENEQHKCLICQKWTQIFIAFKDTTYSKEYYLCEEHSNRDGLDQVTKPITEKIEKKKYKQYEGFIPEDLDEAVNFLIENRVDTNDSHFHFSVGMNIRNNWGLWHNATPIAQWFTERGLYHGDDRSGILQKAVRAKINEQEFDLDKEIKYYQDWWYKQYGEKCSLENMKKDFLENALTEADYE